MGLRKTGIGIISSMATSFVIVIVLVLLWGNLNALVEGMNVGVLMFLNANFWQFLAFFMGLVFIVTLVIRFAMNAKFGGKAE